MIGPKAEALKKGRKKDPIGFWKIARVAYPLVFHACPAYYIMQQFIAVAHGLSHAVTATAMMWLFDGVTQAAEGALDLAGVLRWFAVFVGVSAVAQVLNGVHNFMHGVVYKRMEGAMGREIHAKASRIPPICYEDPSKLDDIEKASKGAGSIFGFLFITTTLMDFYLPYFMYMAVFLYRVNPILILALVAAFLPAMLSQVIRTKVLSKLEDQAAPLRREYISHENALCDIKFMKETRILGGFHYIKRLYLNSILRLNRKNFCAKGKSELYTMLLNTFSMALYGCVILYAVFLLMNSQISVGAFAAVYGSLGMIFGIMDEIVNRHLGTISQNYGLIRNFIRFMEMEETGGKHGVMAENPGVVLEGVSFRYPMAKADSLTDINLTIKPGETVAIVGENGAGKTTLVRLITGLYQPTGGRVEVGGLDTASYRPKSICARITGVLQKYQRYKMTLKDNVHISNYEGREGIEPVARRAGIPYEDREVFPEGEQTMLSREFDGVDLSGGQWQRVALARGFYRDHSLIALDEPTAAIDPIEETRIYRQFIESTRDKTAVIVTHRMGSATIADRVVVMDRGRIVDIGTHEELMRREGLYYRMFTAQSSWYANE